MATSVTKLIPFLQGYIVGRVEGTEALSLRPGGTKYDRFPPFASIRQTYQVQTVWGINLK